MGRELKRVPKDFDHPLKVVWPGYLSPQPRPCPNEPECVNGYTAARQWLDHLTQLLLMLSGETPASRRNLHPWLATIGHRPIKWDPDNRYHYETIRPSADIQELTTGLAGREPSYIGHDSIDRHNAVSSVITAAGLDPDNWGICASCDGHGHHPEDTFDDWEPTEPPPGDGYQMWETTSEGSPATPVFDTLRELAEYCAEHCTTFGSHTASAEGWEQMLSDGVVSAVLGPGIIGM